MTKRYFFHAISALFLSSVALAQVPATWPTARNELTTILQRYNDTLLVRWDGSTAGTLFGQDHFLANGNRGYDLIDSGTQPILLAIIDSTLGAYKSLGLRSTSIALQYPLLVNAFPNSAKYKAFFKSVVQITKARGMTVQIEVQAAFTDTIWGEERLSQDVANHYVGLTSARFVSEKTQMLQTIIDECAPDYLTVENEPGTEEVNLKHLVPLPVDSVLSYVNSYLRAIDRKGVKIGAGGGTWDSFTLFRRLTEETSIDFLNMHIYPPHLGFLDPMIFRIDSLARAAGKDLIIGEAWCYKTSLQELLQSSDPVATSGEFYSRDFFDYWIPVDTLFLKAVVNTSHYIQAKMTTFFWPTIFFGYNTWDPAIHGTMSLRSRITAGQQIGYQRMLQQLPSATGLYLKQLIASQPTDVVGDQVQPRLIEVSHNYPNPFNPSTTVRYTMPGEAQVRLSVYDITGREVAVLVNGRMGAGIHEATFDAVGHASGVYFYRLVAGEVVQTRQLVFLR